VVKLLAILRFIRRSTVLLGVGLVGGTVTTAGVVMLVTPGPGLVVIITGLAILATQFAWAERALEKVKERARSAKGKASAHFADRRERAATNAANAANAAANNAGNNAAKNAGNNAANNGAGSPVIEGGFGEPVESVEAVEPAGTDTQATG
jgi:uncharacterized protein (TIGR02611 family)